MKIEVDNAKIIIYLYNYFFKNYEKKSLVDEIKKIFLRLIKYYDIEIKGVYEVLIYQNDKYGTILEIIKQEELLFPNDFIDIKVKFYKNINFYLRTKDYFILKDYSNVKYYNGYYYINILDVDNILKVLEFTKILYKEKDNYLDKMKLIK